MDIQIKSFTVTKADFVEGERAVIGYISTRATDRDGERLIPNGCKLNEYKKAPVVLWSHDPTKPCGRNEWIQRDSDGLIAKTSFASTPLGEEIYTLYKEGVLTAFSVGFMPITGHAPTPKEVEKDPDLANCRYVYDKWELREYSCVSIPANTDALATAVSKGWRCTSPELSDIAALAPTPKQTPDEGETRTVAMAAEPELVIQKADIGLLIAQQIGQVLSPGIADMCLAVKDLRKRIDIAMGRL